MGLIEVVLIVLGVGMIVITLLPFLPADVWWIRGWEFPRVQIASVTMLVLILYLLWQQQFSVFALLFTMALALCLLYQGARIFPYTPLAGKQVQASQHPQAETTIRLLFANVEMTNRRAERLKEIIRAADPDVFLTVETDEWWLAQLQEFAETYPYTVWHPQDNYYGMMLFSRLELVEPQLKFLVEDDIPSIHTRVRLRDGREVKLHCLHPRPPVLNDGNERSTERDAELLIVGREVENAEGPTVVLGDLNDVAWSHTTHLFERISGLLDPRVGRGFYNSFNAHHAFLRFPLDHLYHSNHFRLVDFERLPAFGSDHFPMFVILNLEPEATAEQAAEPETEKDEEEANEKIQEVA